MTTRLVASAPTAFSTYWEPFAGSAVLFFALGPSNAVLADTNGELINAYHYVSEDPGAVWHSLNSLSGDRETYLHVRARPEATGSFEAAIRFLYLNRYCFNGVYRTNKRGEFNVPFGSRQGRIPPLERYKRAAEAFRPARLLNADFEATLDGISTNDFVYLDPPFTHRSSTYGEFGYGAFGKADEPRLISCMLDLHERGAHILLSYHDSEALRAGLHGFQFSEVRVYRQVGGSPERRAESTEILVSNYARTETRAST